MFATAPSYREHKMKLPHESDKISTIDGVCIERGVCVMMLNIHV